MVLHDVAPDAVTLPQYFRRSGYFTTGGGKIFHHEADDISGWSESTELPKTLFWPGYVTTNNVKTGQAYVDAYLFGRSTKGLSPGPSVEASNANDESYPDVQIAEIVSKKLRTASKRQPFLLFVGFVKPHLPFACPSRYWNLYRPEDLSDTTDDRAPSYAPMFDQAGTEEIRAYSDIPSSGPIPRDITRRLLHGYHACVSFVDAQIGKVLMELHRLNLDDSTIVVLWSDNGFQLGENGLWAKAGNHEAALRTPLIIGGPGVPRLRTDRIVESIDVFPTVAALCGLPTPRGIDGRSLTRVLDGSESRDGKDFAVSQIPSGPQIMSYSLRTKRHRLTLSVDAGGNHIVARELYDHLTDPMEGTNLAENVSVSELVSQLTGLLVDAIGLNLPR